MTDVAIVGASLAGVRVAESLRSAGFEGSVTLIGDEPHLPYDRPPLSKSTLAEPDSIPATFHDLTWYRDNDVVLRLGERARRLDVDHHTVHTDAGTVRYDELVVATGAVPRTVFPDAPAGVFTLRTIDDAQRIREAFRTAARIVVVGGGFIGLEIASSARQLGLDVTVIELAAIPLSRNLGDSAAQPLVDLARRHGVRVLCGRSVATLLGVPSVEAVALDDGTVLECDAVVVGVGAVPATAWLEGSGLELDRRGLICDATGRAGPHVWAAGDVCAWADTDGIPRRHEHWTSATEQAAIVAHNIVSDDKRTLASAQYVWSDQFGARISIIGDTTSEAHLLPHSDDLAALYFRDDILVGACIVDQPRLMIRCRRWIATRSSRTDIDSLYPAVR
ncbi:NAD(P)/FAD-dependent oxidoreductase [Rhodococcus artemisiae]|uniref:FAD-dependent oxidoreductase n=1 Tax=Rhodococcus artemisiae TaxID=714159 RepID=A0ABU7LGT8_9NOCA|nr:FAD-dependent oxidoreductase [Rhodococcus artemisiae]MEE2060758.1 FAD-dependent oxidoreductase [Rhodococcus artemisiae]